MPGHALGEMPVVAETRLDCRCRRVAVPSQGILGALECNEREPTERHRLRRRECRGPCQCEGLHEMLFGSRDLSQCAERQPQAPEVIGLATDIAEFTRQCERPVQEWQGLRRLTGLVEGFAEVARRL